MRRVFPLFLLLAAPLLVNCSDSAMPVAPAGAVLSEGDMPTDAPTEADWATEENWWTPGGAIELPEEEMSAMGSNASVKNVVTMGNPTVGTAFPGNFHDESSNANDKIIPHAMVIDAGENVTFTGTFAHRLAIYNDGVRPEDILNLNPGVFVLYPVGRLFLQPNTANQVTLKFVRPGKYLVICAIKNHFFNYNMYSWLIVR